jgi:anti-sigma-K factor RskA
MSDDVHVLESLPAYALGCLEEGEARLVSEHLKSCYICRTELSTLQTTADQLALMAPDALPSSGLKPRLMERIIGFNQTRPASVQRSLPQRLLLVGVIVGLLLTVSLTVSNFLLWQRINNLEFLTGPQGMRAIALQNTSLAPDASGFVIIGADGRNGVLVVDQLPRLDPQREYQLWLERDARSTSGAVFSVDEYGYRGVRIKAPESLLIYSTVRITIEPVGGNASPTGEEVLGGSLFNP